MTVKRQVAVFFVMFIAVYSDWAFAKNSHDNKWNGDSIYIFNKFEEKYIEKNGD